MVRKNKDRSNNTCVDDKSQGNKKHPREGEAIGYSSGLHEIVVENAQDCLCLF